jgi:Bacterial membrane protein YfhO
VAEVYAYLGILPLTLALAGLSAWRTARRELKFWSAVAVIALLMSFGGATPIYLLLFHVPVYNLFRVPARHLFEVGLALSVIAAIGLDSLLLRPKASTAGAATLARRAFAQISFLLGVAVLAAVALRSLAEGWWYFVLDSVHVNYLYTFGTVKQAIIRNLSWDSPTLVMPFLFFALTGGILFLLARRRLRVTVLVAIPILILADTFFAARRMYDNPSTARMYGSSSRPESDVLRASHFDRDHYRLFPVDFDIGPMARLTSTYHLSTIYPYPLLNVLSALPVINDYGPFWPKRYQAVTGFNAGGGMPIANLQNYKMLSFLGTRYLMVLSAETRQAIEKVTMNMESGLEAAKVFSTIAVTPNGITIFENPSVLPRFRFVHRVRPVQDLDGALSWMNRPDFNPAEEAVVEGINTDMQMAPGHILGEKLEATELQWEVETSGRSFLVAADSFFPGWTATVDGQPAPIYAVYGCVRGIQIQTAGRHRVEMRFAPPGLAAGLACTSAGFLILCLLWLGDRTGHLTRIQPGRHLRSSHPRYKEDAV